MSIECSECERDLRGGHAPDCTRGQAKTKLTGASILDDLNRQYMSVEATSLDALSEGVNAAMRKGWVPQGGICTTNVADPSFCLYVQAMVRAPEVMINRGDR